MKMGIRKRILIVAFSELDRDPRVIRQIHFLKDEYEIVAVGYSNPKTAGVSFRALKPFHFNLFQRTLKAFRLKFSSAAKTYWNEPTNSLIFDELKNEKFDFILVNDIEALPLGVRLKDLSNAKLILDAHEYSPQEFDDNWMFRFFRRDYIEELCKQFLPRVDKMFTVCEGIADLYSTNFKVPCEVLLNTPFYEDLNPVQPSGGVIKMVHHGLPLKARKIENMIELMSRLDDRFQLDFYLYSSSAEINRVCLEKLIKLASGQPRIQFKEAVPTRDLVKVLNSYDIGIFLLDPSALNYRLALPNKLFEFIQARLAVAIWPSPEMARLVRAHSCGVVSTDFSIQSMASTLNALSSDAIFDLKLQSHKAARVLSAEENYSALVREISKSEPDMNFEETSLHLSN